MNITIGAYAGYAMIDGILTEVTVKHITLTNKGKLIYHTDKGDYENLTLYASRQNFEHNIPCSCEACLPDNTLIEGVEEKRYKITAWTMKDGEPVSVAVYPDFKIQGRVEPILDKGYYLTREECLKNETYKYVDKNGNVVERDGIGKKMRLTEKQLDFIQKVLEPALKDANEMGICLVYDYSYDRLCACNMPNDVQCDCYSPNHQHSISSDDMYKISERYIIGISEDTYFYEEEEE